MKKRVAILGATGAVGSVLAGDICRSRVLEPGARLLAMRIDLLDAFDDLRISIMFCADPSRVEADILVVAAGLHLDRTPVASSPCSKQSATV